MIGALLIILGLIVGIAWAFWRLDSGSSCCESVDPAYRTQAAVLLHAARRERQLAQLEAEMERRAQRQLDRWERGDWGGGW